MARQSGLITRPQALAAGVPADVLARQVRDGLLVSTVRGVYAEKEFIDALASPRDRRLVKDRSASLRVRAPHVASHDFAADEHGLVMLYPDRRFTHITRPGVVGAHLVHGVKHHLAPFPEAQVVDICGRRVLSVARTAVDVAREHGNPAGIVAVDHARRLGVPVSEFGSVLELMKSWPHVTRAREAIELSDDGVESAAETLGRLLISELGYGRPQTQFGLTSDGRTVWIDLMLGRHGFEIDGKIKYTPIDEGGVATLPPREVLWQEKIRQDFISGFKIGISRLTWADFFGSARARAAERCRREYLDTCRRFGTDAADLAPYRARARRPDRQPGAA